MSFPEPYQLEFAGSGVPKVPCQDMSRCGQLCAYSRGCGEKVWGAVGRSVVSPAEDRGQSPGLAGSGPVVRQGSVSGLPKTWPALEGTL